MKTNPELIGKIVLHHIGFWKESNVNDYMGGPFSDRSGGLITFSAITFDEATEIIHKDPFVIENILSDKWINEWVVE